MQANITEVLHRDFVNQILYFVEQQAGTIRTKAKRSNFKKAIKLLSSLVVVGGCLHTTTTTTIYN